jgi:hypothetical protein
MSAQIHNHRAAPGPRRGQTLALSAELIGTLVVLAACGAAGALLLAIAEDGYSTFQALIEEVAFPAAAVIAAIAVLAALTGRKRLLRGILVGFLAGLAGTVALEVVREIGFRAFESMPGDLPKLMGVLLTGRIMRGPDTWSNIAGWSDHFWNGAMFAIPYTLLLGGFPQRGKHWHGALLGAGYGILLGTGFLLSPVPRAMGAGTFGTLIGPKFAITVYLAHIGFGATMGVLVHRFAAKMQPIWTPALALARRLLHAEGAAPLPV